jgi:hypothetical protein
MVTFRQERKEPVEVAEFAAIPSEGDAAARVPFGLANGTNPVDDDL